MPSFKGKYNGVWTGGSNQSEGSTLYGKLSGAWAYAKSAWVKKDGTWQRAWTDCRAVDATGGRDWVTVPDTPADTYSGSCGNRTRTDYTTYTKTGCPDDVRGSTVADPSCTSGCYSASGVDCQGCGSRTYYDGSANNCTSYYEGTCGTWNTVEPSTSGRANGSYWVPYAYGNDPRLIVFNSAAYFFEDQNICAVCNCGIGENFDFYTVQRCSADPNSYRWTDHACLQIYGP